VVTLPSTFRVYDVQGNRITGFRDVHASAGVSAQATAPSTYAFPTFSHPNGTLRLVQILSGPYAGNQVSPDDPGVRYTPSG
jgi:hypothetical protein